MLRQHVWRIVAHCKSMNGSLSLQKVVLWSKRGRMRWRRRTRLDLWPSLCARILLTSAGGFKKQAEWSSGLQFGTSRDEKQVDNISSVFHLTPAWRHKTTKQQPQQQQQRIIRVKMLGTKLNQAKYKQTHTFSSHDRTQYSARGKITVCVKKSSRIGESKIKCFKMSWKERTDRMWSGQLTWSFVVASTQLIKECQQRLSV